MAVVLGSGLSSLVDNCQIEYSIEYSELEPLGFPCSTVEGHEGRLIFGVMGTRKVILMQGRVHYYEGYSPQQVVLPIRVLAQLGVKSIIMSNSAGALNTTYKVGDMVAINDHISFIPDPLIGANISELGVRFPSMMEPYDMGYISLAHQIANDMGVVLHDGVYIAATGPSYETRAQVRFYRSIGGDVVGMSTVPEVVAAVHAGLKVFALSVVTNVANCGISATPPTHDEVIEAGARAAKSLSQLVGEMLNKI